MGNIEQFGRDFRVQYNKYMNPIVVKLGKKSDISILLDPDTVGGYGDFGKKAWAEVYFLSSNMQKLDEAVGAVLNSTADLVKLDGKGKADTWSTGVPPNTPTLVAMQRLLMRLSGHEGE